MHNVSEIQARLISLGYLAALNEKGERNDDGKFGERSLDAYNHFRASKGKPPVVQASMAELNADLFPEEQPASAPKVGLNPVLTTIINIALSTMKGKGPMLTTMDKAWVAGVVSFVCNYIVNHFFHITVDDGTQGVIVNLVVTFILPLVAVWLVPNKPKTA